MTDSTQENSRGDLSPVSCRYCPIIIPPMQDALDRASRLPPGCVSREKILLLELIKIATVDPTAASHMARGAGAMDRLIHFCHFPSNLQRIAFLAFAGHDEGKVTVMFHNQVGRGQAVTGDKDSDGAKKAPAETSFTSEQRQALIYSIFSHLKYSPLGNRVLHEGFDWPADEVLKLRIAIGALHHFMGSGIPTLNRIDGMPHIDDFVYHSGFPNDREYVLSIAKAMMNIRQNAGSLEELKNLMSKNALLEVAGLVLFATLVDIIDAMHQRSYLPKMDPSIEDISESLSRSALPPFMQKLGLEWYSSFVDPTNYYNSVLFSGWEEYIVPVVMEHNKTHVGESCPLSCEIVKAIPMIRPGYQISSWIERVVVPNLHLVEPEKSREHNC